MLMWIAAALFAAALLLFLRNRHNRQLGGLPSGELVSSDNALEECPVLVSHRYGLKGKPDALVRLPSGALVPVGRAGSRRAQTRAGAQACP